MLQLENLIVDKEGKRFKIFSKFLGIKLGEWTQYQEANYIAITKVRFAKTVSSPKLMGNKSCTSDFTDFKFVVFICKDARVKQMIFKGDFEKAKTIAERVGEYLEIKTVDYTKDEN